MRLELQETEPLTGNYPERPLSSISVELDTNSRQPEVAGGLKLSLVLRNRGPKRVGIQKPDDAVWIELLDAGGAPLVIPASPPAALINERRKPGPYPNAPEILKIEPGNPYHILIAVRVVGHGTEAEKRFPIPPGRYRVRVGVLLLASEADLDRESSYRIMVSDWVPVRFGPDQER